MDRRESIKRLMMASGGLVALPAWARGWTKDDVSMDPDSFCPPDEKLLSLVVDTIIPAGPEGVGGISEGVDLFLVRLLDQCYELDTQENVTNQLTHLDMKARDEFGAAFVQCDQQQRMELLQFFAHSDLEEEKNFYDLIKRETIRGFRTSRKVMTRYYQYRVAPGHYFGCINVEVQ